MPGLSCPRGIWLTRTPQALFERETSQNMSCQFRTWCVATWLSALALAGAPTAATAQSSQSDFTGITLSRFQPAETLDDDFQISRPTDQGHLRFGLQLHGDYANSPLVIEQIQGDVVRSTEVVAHQATATIGLSFGLWDRLVLFAGIPIVAHMAGENDDLANTTLSETSDPPGPGNLYIGARLRLVGEANSIAAVALQATMTAPTAGSAAEPDPVQEFRGEHRFGFHPELLFELRPGPVRVTLNTGARIHKKAFTRNIKQLTELTFGLGVSALLYQAEVEPLRHLDFIVQAYGATEFSNFLDKSQTPLEAIAGLKFFHETGLAMGVAAGPGLASGVGTPDFRIVGMLGWQMPDIPPRVDTDGDGWKDDEDDCIAQPEDMDGYEDTDGCPDPDDDNDGLADEQDQCRTEAEDMDGFEDEDGCPDRDNDSDGLLDRADKCPGQAEDLDGFEDIDGCPDLDNDQDGIPDSEDECAVEAGTADNHGCPARDRDNDGIPDNEDNCPDEPGEASNHGCKKKQQVVIAKDRLEISDVIYFRSGKAIIETRSYDLLLNIAQVINNHPEIPSILIEGHTDSRGSRRFNVGLSRARADAVKEFLVRSGNVDPGRLATAGYGPDRPLIAGATTPTEHAQNRRVEFSFATRQVEAASPRSVPAP